MGSVVSSEIPPVGHAQGAVKSLVVADNVGGLRSGVHLTSAPSTVWNVPTFFGILLRRFQTDAKSFPEGYICHTATTPLPPAAGGTLMRLPDKPALDAAHPAVQPGGGFVCWVCNEYDGTMGIIDSVDTLVRLEPSTAFTVGVGESTMLIFQRLLDDSSWTVHQM
jgi:hypothetical protein